MSALQMEFNGITFNTNTADGDGNKWYSDDWAGWDGAPVRQSVENRTGNPGGFTGVGQYGPRSVTIKGIAKCPTEAAFWTAWNGLSETFDECLQTTKLMKVTEGSTTKRLNVQAAMQLRKTIDGSLQMRFEIPLIAPDPAKYHDTLTTTALDATVSNAGTYVSWPTITFSSSGTDVTVENTTTGETVTITSVANGDVLDFRYKTFESSGGANKYANIVLGSTTWWGVRPGNNTIDITNASGSISFRSAWI